MATNKNYTIGRGQVAIAIRTGGTLGSYTNVGNAPELNVSIEIETVDHVVSTGGINIIDEMIPISIRRRATLVLDEVSANFYAYFLSGTVAADVVSSGSSLIDGGLRFTESNPRGSNRIWTMPEVYISPGADLSLINDQWRTIPLSVEIRQPTSGSAITVSAVQT